MARFTKTILECGSHQSPDGEVVVTPERLHHWQNSFRRMRDAGHVIPIDWDHAEDAASAVPLSLTDYEKRRSAKNTVGKLHDFRVAADGKSAEIVLDVEKSDAAESAEKNLIYVSPVIFDSWRDGSGTEFKDIITHVDFVNHPVDHKQSPFVPAQNAPAIACAIRMGLSKPYRLGDIGMADDDKKPDDDGEDKGADENKPVEGSKLKDVIASLADMQIVLSDDTDETNFLDHLHQSLLTAKAMRDGDAGDDTGKGDGGAAKPTVAGDPGIATMSLQARSAHAYAERIHREKIATDLKVVFDSGRCSPEEYKKQVASLGAVRLSLDDKGNPGVSKVEEWIESRSAVPAGTFWDSAKRTRMSTVAEPQAGVLGESSPEDDAKLAHWALTGKR